MLLEATYRSMKKAKAGHRRAAREFLKEAVLLLPRLARLLYRLMRDPRVSRTDKILLAATLAYLANPVDLVPDFLPVVGQADDLLAVSLVLLRLIDHAGEEVLREHWTGDETLVPRIHKTARYTRILLPAGVRRSIRSRFGK